jgi:hypothetical protein
MREIYSLCLVCLLGIFSLSGLSSDYSARQLRMDAVPQTVLWAWELPEDLRFVDVDGTGIAFLAGSFDLQAQAVTFQPRLQPLEVPNRAKLIAVFRLNASNTATLPHEQQEQIISTIAPIAALPRVVAVQLDFDATSSQRAPYRDLLLSLRRRLPANMPLSITALASWCLDDDWVRSLPIDEAVPMLFRMGAGANHTVTQLASGREFRSEVCRDSLGISTDERWASLPSGRRLYIFRSRPWTAQAESSFLWSIKQWR